MIGIGLLSLLFNAGCKTASKIEREVKDYHDINSGSSFRYGGYEIHYNSRGKECLANGAEVIISETPIDYGQYMHRQLIMGRTGTVLYDNMPEILKQKEEKRKEREDWYQLNPEYQLQKGYLAYYQYNDDYDPARPIEISTGREIGRLWVCEDCVCRKWYADDPDDAPGIPITLEELCRLNIYNMHAYNEKGIMFQCKHIMYYNELCCSVRSDSLTYFKFILQNDMILYNLDKEREEYKNGANFKNRIERFLTTDNRDRDKIESNFTLDEEFLKNFKKDAWRKILFDKYHEELGL